VPCLAGKKKKLDDSLCLIVETARVPDMLPSLLACFLPGRAKDLSAPWYICVFWDVSLCFWVKSSHCFKGYIYIYRVSQEECARLREGVPYAKVYQYNPKHLRPKLNGYGDNGQ